MTNRTIGALGWLALLALAVGCGRSESGGSAAEGDPGGEQLAAAAASDSGAPEGVNSLDHSTTQPTPDSASRTVRVDT